MAKREAAPSAETFEERTRQFLRTHRRIVADFERSLKNARHFIKLAGRSMEQEPDATVTMIEQVREIDLLRHVSHQLEEFLSVAAMMPAAPAPGQPAPADESARADIKSLRARYEALVEEAESQAEEIERILSALQSPH